MSLVAGVGEPTVDLDLAATGRVRLATADIPNSVRVGDEERRRVGRYSTRMRNGRRAAGITVRLPLPPATLHRRAAGRCRCPPRGRRDRVHGSANPKTYRATVAAAARVSFRPQPDALVPGQHGRKSLERPLALDLRLLAARRISRTITADQATMLTVSIVGEPLQARFDRVASELTGAKKPPTAMEIATAAIKDVKIDVQVTPLTE